MTYAIIDTETTGLFDFSKPADAEGQPRLAHLAMILANDDFTDIREVEFFVKPDGWEMSDEAGKVNGLTTEYLNEHGVPVREALQAYSKAIEDGRTLVAFNAQYDLKVMRGEMRRADVPDLFEQTKNICVMRALTDICQIPKKTGKGFKFPKLSEACAHFEIVNAAEHSAIGDARAAAELFKRLMELKQVPEPKVYFAKNPPETKPEAV